MGTLIDITDAWWQLPVSTTVTATSTVESHLQDLNRIKTFFENKEEAVFRFAFNCSENDGPYRFFFLFCLLTLKSVPFALFLIASLFLSNSIKGKLITAQCCHCVVGNDVAEGQVHLGLYVTAPEKCLLELSIFNRITVVDIPYCLPTTTKRCWWAEKKTRRALRHSNVVL